MSRENGIYWLCSLHEVENIVIKIGRTVWELASFGHFLLELANETGFAWF
jgi:hypothetical protein